MLIRSCFHDGNTDTKRFSGDGGSGIFDGKYGAIWLVGLHLTDHFVGVWLKGAAARVRSALTLIHSSRAAHSRTEWGLLEMRRSAWVAVLVNHGKSV